MYQCIAVNIGQHCTLNIGLAGQWSDCTGNILNCNEWHLVADEIYKTDEERSKMKY